MPVESKLLAVSENKIVELQQDIINRSFKAITSHSVRLAELDESCDFFETRDPSIIKEGTAKKRYPGLKIPDNRTDGQCR